MPRLILIDHGSGYIFGDTASYAFNEQGAITPVDAARLLDEREVHEFGRSYEEHGPDYRPAANENAYHVYRADLGGSEAVAVVQDGQDQAIIAAVERDCQKIAVVTIGDHDEAADGDE